MGLTIFELKHKYLFYFSVVDDVFVRKDLLISKYNFVNFPAAEEYKSWCSDYTKCNFFWDSIAETCIAPGFSQILAEFSD